jgi:apolipoprotein N-acyltransferase
MKGDKIFKASYVGDGCALLSGILLTLAFAPFNAAILAIIAPALLLSLWLNVSPRRAFYRGWLFGLGFFGSGVYWVYISIHTYGNSSVFISAFITIGLINILALFPAYTGFFLNRYFPKNNTTKIICAFPVIWIFLEWVRSWLATGFPWLQIGYSQINMPLRGYAPLFSVYGVSFLTLLTSALLLNAVLNFIGKKRVVFAYLNLFVIVLIWIIGAGLSHIIWTQSFGAPVKVSLVQGNIAQEVKWAPESIQPTLDTYADLTKQHLDSPIIIWPEGAIPIPLQDAVSFLKGVSLDAKNHSSTVITGIPIQVSEDGGYYNGIVAVGNGTGLYLKHRLVPFGEYIPFEKYLHHLLDILHIPMSDFRAGKQNYDLLLASGVHISSFICYEIAFPEQVRSTDPNIDALLTVSNDGWFGHSIAQAQHLQIGQMRALEMGRPLLFVSNNGITAIINSQGKIQSRIPAFETAVLTDNLQPHRGRTPWQIYGMEPIMLTWIIFLVVAVWNRKS